MVRIIFQVYVYTILIILLRGGEGYPSLINLEQCNYGSWILVALHLTLSYFYSKSTAIRQFKRDL